MLILGLKVLITMVKFHVHCDWWTSIHLVSFYSRRSVGCQGNDYVWEWLGLDVRVHVLLKGGAFYNFLLRASCLFKPKSSPCLLII